MARDAASLNVESAWLDLKQAVFEAAGATVGVHPVRGEQISSHRYRLRPMDAQLQQWKHTMRKLSRLYHGSADPVHRAGIDEQRRELAVKMKHHVRKGMRERQAAEVHRVIALKPTQMREHWEALKAVGGMGSTGSAIPSSARDSGTGQETHEPRAVKRIWVDFWSKLACAQPASDRYDIAHHDVVARYMQDRMRDGDGRQFSQHYEELDVPPDLLQSCIPLNDDIELAEVEVSVKHLLTGKAVGPDAIPSEALKHGGDAMLAALHQLCRLVWRQGEVPMDWLRGVIVPLYKDGDKLLPSNHRPITLLSIVGKYIVVSYMLGY